MRLTLAILALSVVTISATGPSHVVAMQTPAAAAEPTLFGFDPKWLVSTGGLLLCVIILTRLLRETRDDLRGEREQNRKDREQQNAKMEAAFYRVADAGHAQALSTQRSTDTLKSSLTDNTKATETLAREVRALAERRREDRT